MVPEIKKGFSIGDERAGDQEGFWGLLMFDFLIWVIVIRYFHVRLVKLYTYGMHIFYMYIAYPKVEKIKKGLGLRRPIG